MGARAPAGSRSRRASFRPWPRLTDPETNDRQPAGCTVHAASTAAARARGLEPPSLRGWARRILGPASMDLDDKINPNPEIFEAVRLERDDEDDAADDDDDSPEPFDAQEIYDLVRGISDPEVWRLEPSPAPAPCLLLTERACVAPALAGGAESDATRRRGDRQRHRNDSHQVHTYHPALQHVDAHRVSMCTPR